jgi:Flp pilus assembly pilin Flp
VSQRIVSNRRQQRKKQEKNMTQLRMMIARHAVWLSELTELRLEKEEGQTLAEYALILALVAAVVLLQGTITGLFNTVSSGI